jgi:hypothetical protein
LVGFLLSAFEDVHQDELAPADILGHKSFYRTGSDRLDKFVFVPEFHPFLEQR